MTAGENSLKRCCLTNAVLVTAARLRFGLNVKGSVWAAAQTAGIGPYANICMIRQVLI